MKKFFQKMLCAAFVAAMLPSAALLSSADQSKDVQLNVPIRIEGVDGNIYYDTVNVSDSDGEITAADALIFADEKSDDIEIKGADTGYITEINGTAAGKFGGYDGWYYCVNNEVPSVGVNEFNLKDGDSLTVYYGGFPCQIPFFDTSKLESDGIIVFKSNDEEYDENWNATKVVNFVTEADVTVNGEKYTTDKNGEIKLADDTPEGELDIQISKKDSSGAPCVLRFAPDQTISYKSADSSTDSIETDSDTASDLNSDTDSSADTEKSSDTQTDTKKDSEKDTDTQSDNNSSSKSSSSSAGTSASTSTGTVRSSTAAAATAVTTTSAAAAVSSDSTPAATGDRRTTFTLIIFGAAALVVMLMFVIGKLKGNKE